MDQSLVRPPFLRLHEWLIDDYLSEENAINLVYGFIGLQDNYDLDNFSQKRQAALNALVACCPRKAAP